MIEIGITGKTYTLGHNLAPLEVLQAVQFTIEPGEFCCIVGPSGCGKTSLLNLISGLDQDFGGSIAINGGKAGQAPTPGYMFQASRLMPWLTVRENIELVTEGTSSTRIDDILLEIGLADFADSYPNRLSGGMQRRVALARALIIEPPLLLLDEPFSSLDQPVANRLRRLLIEVCSRHATTALFVTHDLREALLLADRILFISSRPGKIVLDYRVPVERPREPESQAIEMTRLDLLNRYPQLLAGLVGTEEETDP